MILGLIVLSWSDIIAIYAGVISTAAIIIEIIRLNKEFKNRIVVKVSLNAEWEVFYTETKFKRNVILISCTNDSSNPRFIERPNFETDKETKSGKVFSFVPNGRAVYPVNLNLGEVHEFKVESRDVLDQIKGTEVSKIRGLVTDTLGKTYSSKWVKVKDINP